MDLFGHNIRSVVLVICAAAIAWAANTVLAQDRARIPTAITERDLRQTADLLKLSDDQRMAVEGLFERYFDEFGPLREEMIELAIQYPRYGAHGSEGVFLQRMLPFLGRIRELDQTFFGRIEPLLIESQRTLMPRVRALRERQLYARLDILGRVIGDGVPDLSELLRSLDPPDDVIAPSDAALAAYEMELTNQLRALFAGAPRLFEKDDAAARDAMIERVQHLRAFNRLAFDSLHKTLPESLRRPLRDAFFLRAYGAAVEATRFWMLPQIDAALALPGLADQEREEIAALRRDSLQKYDQVVNELAEMLDRETIRPAPVGGAVARDVYFQTINGASHAMMDEQMNWRRRLANILGEERFEKIKRATFDPFPRPQGRWELVGSLVTNTNTLWPKPDSPPIGITEADPLVATPICGDEIDDYMNAWGLNPEQRDRTRILFADYSSHLGKELEPLREERARFEIGKIGEPREKPDPFERARELDALRQKTRTIVENADAAIFEQVHQMFEIDREAAHWKRVTDMRRRARVNLDFSVRRQTDANYAAEIDVVRLIVRHAGAMADETLAKAMIEYESKLDSLLKSQFDLYTQYMFDSRATQDGWRGEDGRGTHRQLSDQAEQIHKTHHAVAELNKAMIRQLFQVLPDRAAALVREDFNRSAYPEAYKDSFNMHSIFASTFALPDLSGEQRDRLGALRAEFAEAYESVRQRLVEVCAAYPPDLPMVQRSLHPDRSKSEETFEQRFAQCVDERAAVNRRALRALRLILSPAQLARFKWPEVIRN